MTCQGVTFTSLMMNIRTVEYDEELCTGSPLNFADVKISTLEQKFKAE